MSELTLTVPPELVDAIAEAVAANLTGRLPVAGERDEWRLWSEQETAERLGRSTRWVRERAKEGSLPSVRLDAHGGRMYDPEDVKAFAKARRMPLEESGPRLRA